MPDLTVQDYERQLRGKFPAGKPADPTVNMSAEDKAKWEAMNAEHGDKFKSADQGGTSAINHTYASPSEESLMPEPTITADLIASYRALDEVTAADESDTDAKFEKGKPADPTVNMSPEDKKKWKSEKEKNKDKFKGATEGDRERLSWGREASTDHEAASGLYGYTKATQRDVEASIRKFQRQAGKVASQVWGKDQGVVAFLTTHAKRASSAPAHILLAAMKGLGPKVASQNRLALNECRGNLYDNIMFIAEANHMAQATNDPTQAITAALGLVRQANPETNREDFRAISAMLERDLVARWDEITKTAYTPSARRLDETKALIMRYAAKGRPFTLQAVYEDPSDPADLDLYHAFRDLVASGTLKGPDPFRATGNHDDWVYRKGSGTILELPAARVASQYSMYGFKVKTAALGLSACSGIRQAAGHIAYNLHMRRLARHERITGFLKEHGKTAKCRYSKLLLASYPDAPPKPVKAAETTKTTKTASMPSSVDEWIAWE